MCRALKFLPDKKQMAGMAIAAIATMALTAPGLSQGNGNNNGNDEVFQVTAVIQVPGAPALFSFDISWVDPVLGRYFLADRNNKAIDVIDPTNLAAGVIQQFVNPGYAGVNPGGNDFSGPDGVLTANNSTELWVGDSPGKVWVLNSKNGNIKKLPGGAANPILVGGTTRADELCYDPRDNLIMIASPAEDPPFVTFISTTTYKVVSQLKFDAGSINGNNGQAPKATNGLEQCAWSPTTGKFYQNVPEVNGAGNDTSPGAVAVINPLTRQVETAFPVPIDACAGPQGMALGPQNQILLGCNASSPDGHRNTAIISATDGSLLATFADLGGADEVWFNPGDGHYFIPSCNTACRTVGAGGQEVLGVVDASTRLLDQSVIVAAQNGDTVATSGNPRTTHSVAADPNTNQVFLPIPACTPGNPGVCGNVPHFAPTLCDTRGRGITVVGSPSTSTGCIVVLAVTNSSVAQAPQN